MSFRKSTIILFIILTITIFPTSVSFAQSWGEILLGVGSALLENHIDNSNRYSSQDKESMKNTINDLNNSISVNQNARNATKDINQGNYTGAIIQGAQTIINAAGNHDYDTYLNSANQINKANREYEQDIQNGMNKDEALEKRNTTIGYSTAESIIELQDKIARERLEKARQQREAERQSWENNNFREEAPIPNGNSTGASTIYPNESSSVMIAHINTSAIIDALPEKLKAEKELENYYNGLQNQLKSLYDEYQNKLQIYQANAETMSNSEKQSKEKELIDLERQITDFQANAENRFEDRRAELLKPILNKIQNAINSVAGENDLTYVIDISTGAAVFLGEDSIDITYMVMKRLGI